METKDLVIYRTQEGDVSINVVVENDTVWLTQSQMGMLFEKNRTVIGRHIKNVFEEGELQKGVVCANFAHTTPHGAISGKTQTPEVGIYNLSVGMVSRAASPQINSTRQRPVGMDAPNLKAPIGA